MPFADTTAEEWGFIQQATSDLNDDQKNFFYMVYSSKRRKPQDIFLVTLLGFFGVAGVQRFITGQTGMGLLYFFTCGLFFIGTIVDVICYKDRANEFNRKMAFESYQITKINKP